MIFLFQKVLLLDLTGFHLRFEELFLFWSKFLRSPNVYMNKHIAFSVRIRCLVILFLLILKFSRLRSCINFNFNFSTYGINFFRSSQRLLRQKKYKRSWCKLSPSRFIVASCSSSMTTNKSPGIPPKGASLPFHERLIEFRL